MLNGESVPNDEKVFSLFEPHTELIKRGKVPVANEFGHRVLVVEDAAGFIVHIEVMGIGVQDAEVLAPTIERVKKRLEEKIKQGPIKGGRTG